VAKLALSLFDQTKVVHGLGSRERNWLEYASLLHDVGMQISYERHHRHSYYLIMNGDLRGFEPEEISVIALVARYHRRAAPDRQHDGYGDLSSELRKVVKVLSAFLRIAETLDRSRNGVIAAVDVRARGRELSIVASGVGDCELEVWAAARQLPVLAKALRCRIALEARAVQEGELKPRVKRKRAAPRAA
jgi:exopolyphosphatase/guanosine-5'-triphosphate,3'-diphosphate pyrophosphatase